MTSQSLAPLSSEDRGLEFISGGDAFFPKVLAAIGAAKREIMIEIYILERDNVGLSILEALRSAAKRGVRVRIVVDAFGSPSITLPIAEELIRAGVQIKIFRPLANWWQFGRFFFRRLHRKTIVIDEDLAFVAGLNFSNDYARQFSANAKWDCAVMVRGSLARQVRWHSVRLWKQLSLNILAFIPAWRRHPRGVNAYVVSDSQLGFRSIERTYSKALERARDEVLIANAYFFPSPRFVRLLERTAARGVQVRILLQGHYSDLPFLKLAERSLYKRLLKAGVNVYEFNAGPLHAKAAVIDLAWSIVGSSNLDPWSFFSNLEGDIVSMDTRFALDVRRGLQEILDHQSTQVDPASLHQRGLWTRLTETLAYYSFRYALHLTKLFNR